MHDVATRTVQAGYDRGLIRICLRLAEKRIGEAHRTTVDVGITHGDIKPGNVLRSDDIALKIFDWGHAARRNVLYDLYSVEHDLLKSEIKKKRLSSAEPRVEHTAQLWRSDKTIQLDQRFSGPDGVNTICLRMTKRSAGIQTMLTFRFLCCSHFWNF